MKLIKLLFLLPLFTLHSEKLLLPLLDSYEYQILEEKGAPTLQEYITLFKSEGLSIKEWKIQRNLMIFENEDALKTWIHEEIAPHFTEVNKEHFVEIYFTQMKEKGWLDYGDGKIRFPQKQLLVLFD